MNLQENIRKVLREESLRQTLMDEIERFGIQDTASIMGVSIEELLDMVGIKGTKDNMIFLTKSIMENEAKEEFNYCSYNIVPTRYSINIDVYIPKPAPENENRYMFDQRIRDSVHELISMLLYKLGGGLIRGHNIHVSNTGNC
jgi:hypothetical protein